MRAINGVLEEKTLNIRRKPEWLRKRNELSEHKKIYNLIEDLSLNTICKEALCPNISECFKNKQATFLILGRICTRRCSFCNVDKAVPTPPDENEAERVAEAIKRMGLKFVVITSPTRDDISDGGASYFISTIDAIKKKNPDTLIEILIPDFRGDKESIKKIAHSKADIVSHNLETVERLYDIRKGADYGLSLELLREIKSSNPDKPTKSGIMLGLGETEPEIIKLMKDLLSVQCSFLSIGQYLQPSLKHYPVVEYVTPEYFEKIKNIGLELGFKHIESGPYVRSSYMAEKYIN